MLLVKLLESRIFPDDDSDEFDGSQIYEQGERWPLLPHDRDSEPEPKGTKEPEVETIESDESKHGQEKCSEPDKDTNPVLG